LDAVEDAMTDDPGADERPNVMALLLLALDRNGTFKVRSISAVIRSSDFLAGWPSHHGATLSSYHSCSLGVTSPSKRCATSVLLACVPYAGVPKIRTMESKSWGKIWYLRIVAHEAMVRGVWLQITFISFP